MCFITHLVYEGTQRGEDVLQSHLRLRDLQEAHMNLEHLLHERVVSQISTQLRLEMRCSKNSDFIITHCILPLHLLPYTISQRLYLKAHDEDAEGVQDRQTHFSGNVGLQQTCIRINMSIRCRRNHRKLQGYSYTA